MSVSMSNYMTPKVRKQSNPMMRPRCPCGDASRYHSCVDLCRERFGCNGGCTSKRHEQKLVKARHVQSLAAALLGPIQTTPRAELYAILLAVVHGISPQLIISDHANHVNAIQRMARGDLSVFNPLTPNVDLWRLLVRAQQIRSGLRPDGDSQLWIEWQPAHTHANIDETVQQKNRRRGNRVEKPDCSTLRK